MRTALKTIAIVLAVIGGFLLVGSVIICVAGILNQKSILLSILLTLVTALVGGVILIGGLRHIRNPSKATARDIASSAAVLLWMFGSAPVYRYFTTKYERTDVAYSIVPFLITVGIPYLIYRIVLKRIANAAFEDEKK